MSKPTSGPVLATWLCLSLAWAFFLIPIPGLGIAVGMPLCLVSLILSIVVLAKGNTSGGLVPLLLTLIASPIVWVLGLGLFAMFVTKNLGEAGTYERSFHFSNQ